MEKVMEEGICKERQSLDLMETVKDPTFQKKLNKKGGLLSQSSL
jgi:hypothetical protein